MTRAVVPVGTVVPAATPATGTAPAFASEPTDDRAAYAPNFLAGPTGIDPYRQWSRAVLDGYWYGANGRDQPWRWDGAADKFNLGAEAPTGYTLAQVAGSTFTDVTVRYLLVKRNSANGKESCPQLAQAGDPFFQEGAFGISVTIVGSGDVQIAGPALSGEFDVLAVYRGLTGSDTYNLQGTTATLPYTDSTGDDALRTNTPYVPRLRTTLPPKFEGLFEWDNRLWGWELDGNRVHVSQQAGTFQSTELVQEDFPPLQSFGVAPEEGHFGLVRAGRAYDDQAYVWKDRAAYEARGTGISNYFFRMMYGDRGALNDNCIAAFEGAMAILDEQGLYIWAPGGQPRIAGADPVTRESKLLPVWQRLNLAARRVMHIHYDQNARLVKCYVALDHEPVSDTPILYDPQTDTFASLDVGRWGGHAGMMVDGAGGLHSIRGDDLGTAWDEGIGQSAGVTEGDLSATVTGGDALLIECSGASFDTTIDGPEGSPYTRGTAGSAYVDLNRAQQVTSTTIAPVYYDGDAVTAGETLLLGVVPAVAQTPKLTFGTVKKKWVREVVIEHDPGYSGTLTVETACDDDPFVIQASIDMSTAVRTIVPLRTDRCWTWSLRLTQQAAGTSFHIRAIRVLVQLIEDRR